MPVLAVPEVHNLSHSIGQFGPLPDLKGILDDLGKDQHLQHPARQFREPDERMIVFLDLSGSAAKFADACNRFSSNLDVSGL